MEEQVLSALEQVLKPSTSLVILDLVPSNAPFVLPLEAVPLVRERCPRRPAATGRGARPTGHAADLGPPEALRGGRHGDELPQVALWCQRHRVATCEGAGVGGAFGDLTWLRAIRQIG